MSSDIAETEACLRGVASGDMGAVDVLVNKHDGVLDASGLDAETFQLVQIAALASMDASPASWVTHLDAADDTNVQLEKVLGTLLAVAPIVGTARIVSAGAKIVSAAGLTDAIDTLQKGSRHG